MSNVCQHGQLARQCELCLKDSAIIRLTRERDLARVGRDAIEQERDLADEALAACRAEAGGKIEQAEREAARLREALETVRKCPNSFVKSLAPVIDAALAERGEA